MQTESSQTMAGNKIAPTRSNFYKFLIPALAVLLVSGLGFIFFYHIGSHPIVDWDEGIYAQIARESYENHTIADMHWIGARTASNPDGLWFEKPPLMIWLTALTYNVFGVTEFAARFWSTLLALGLVILCFFYVRLLFNSNTAAILSLCMFYLAHFIITQTWFMKMDIPVAFFILLAFFSYELARKNQKYYYLFWVAVALGVMTKNIIGLLPIPILAITAAAEHDWSVLKNRTFYYGLILFLLITAPWHIVETVRYGASFWNSYLNFQLLHRYVSTIDNHTGTFWYYILLFKDNLVFAVLAAASFLYFIYRSWRGSNKHPYLLIIVAVIFIFLLFSFARTKLASYIVPLYPFLIIMIAQSLTELVQAVGHLWLKMLSISVIVVFSVATGFIFNQSKLSDNGYYAHYYFENKGLMQIANQYFPNLDIVAANRDLPSLIFYANREIYGLSDESKIHTKPFVFISSQKPPWPQAQPLAQGQTVAMYLVTIP